MEYQGYNNFSEFTSDKVHEISSLGFNVTGFIGNHTFGIAVAVFLLFIGYKIYIEPAMKGEREEEEE